MKCDHFTTAEELHCSSTISCTESSALSLLFTLRVFSVLGAQLSDVYVYWKAEEIRLQKNCGSSFWLIERFLPTARLVADRSSRFRRKRYSK